MISERRHQWRSFAGGVLSEEMFGRVDLPRAAIGLKRCYNAFISPQGALFNRAGSKYVATTKANKPAWLETFVRPDGQGFLIELTETVARIICAGNVVGFIPGTGSTPGDYMPLDSVTVDGVNGVVFELASHGLSEDDPVILQDMALVNSDVVGAHILMGYLNRTYYVAEVIDADNFTVAEEIGGDAVTWAPLAEAPYNGLITGVNSSDGVVSIASQVPAIELTTPYAFEHLRKSGVAQSVNKLYIANQNYAPKILWRSSGDNFWQFTAPGINATITSPSGIAVTAQGTPGSDPIEYFYTATIRTASGVESAIGMPDSDSNTLRTVGNSNLVEWNSVSPTPFLFEVYKNIGGSVYGWIGSSDTLSFVDDNIDPDYTRQPPEELTSFDSTNNYPRTVCFYEQRSVYGGTITAPQSFWASNLGAVQYFQASYPPQDDQAFTYELNALRASPVLHSIALRDLLFFTGSGVFRVYSTGESFTAYTAASIPVVSVGAHESARPQASGANVLFPAARGGHVHQLRYDDTAAGYTSDDLSVIAAHLIDDHGWVQTAFQSSPYPIWYGLRTDGVVIGLTYMPEQEVFAWWEFELPGGFIESIAVVPEGKEDVLYACVKRTIDGSEAHYIERMTPRLTGDAAEDVTQAYFLDCGLTYNGPATDTIDGLDHLEGEAVYALADGRVQGPFTVSGGEITLDDEAELVHVGLAYSTEVETLPIAYVDQQGFGLGVMKTLSQLWLRLKQSLGVKAGISFNDDDLRDLPPLVTDLIGDAPALRDGVYYIDIQPSWSQDVTVCLKQSDPLPLTITGMSADYADAG